jgi:uncharacterized protein YdhG (YjbR/CyaY superfamily)
VRDKPKPQTIDDYIALAPEAAQPRLWEIRAAVERAVPDVEQGIKWSMPAYTDGRILVAFAAYKKHIGFAPTPTVLREFAAELNKYETTSSSVKFPLDKPIPAALVTRMTKRRAEHNAKPDGMWWTSREERAAKKKASPAKRPGRK